MFGYLGRHVRLWWGKCCVASRSVNGTHKFANCVSFSYFVGVGVADKAVHVNKILH